MTRTLLVLAALGLSCNAFVPVVKQGQSPYFCNGPASYYNDPQCCPFLEVLLPHGEDYCPTQQEDPEFCNAFRSAFLNPHPACASFIDFMCDLGFNHAKSRRCDVPCGVNPFQLYTGCFGMKQASKEEQQVSDDKRFGQNIPSSWHCSSLAYGTGDGCDCECGAIDPDCSDSSAHVWGCFIGETCVRDHCVDMSDWTCSPSYYGSGDGCDCNCGVRDPDCDNPSQRLYNCNSGETCNAEGRCEPQIPSTWTCPNSFFGTRDGCDCNCGVQDPDCNVPGQTVHGCFIGQVCRGGRCVSGKEFNNREELKYAASKTTEEPSRSESAHALPLAVGGALALVAAVAVVVVAVQRRRRSPMASLEGH